MTTILMGGCATTTRSTLLGVGTGAAVGAAGGALLSDEDKGKAVLTSALIMGAIGGITGFFSHKGLEDRDAQVRKDTLFNLEKYGVSGFYNDVNSSTEKDQQKVILITDDPEWPSNNKDQK